MERNEQNSTTNQHCCNSIVVVIIEIYAGRPVRGFPSVLVALSMPIVSFLYFAARFLAQVERWIGNN